MIDVEEAVYVYVYVYSSMVLLLLFLEVVSRCGVIGILLMYILLSYIGTFLFVTAIYLFFKEKMLPRDYCTIPQFF